VASTKAEKAEPSAAQKQPHFHFYIPPQYFNSRQIIQRRVHLVWTIKPSAFAARFKLKQMKFVKLDRQPARAVKSDDFYFLHGKRG
jgi:hypothetical protein